jgi:hypothetical protein
MRTIILLKSANKAATRLAFAALALLVFKGLVLNRLEAPSPAIYDLGVICDSILASIAASYVFYLLVVHLKESTDKSTLAPYLDRHTLRVVGDCRSQLAEISRISSVPLELETVTEAALERALSAIPPYSDAPLILARIFHRTPVEARTALPFECSFIEVSNLDERAGNAEAKLYRRS